MLDDNTSSVLDDSSCVDETFHDLQFDIAGHVVVSWQSGSRYSEKGPYWNIPARPNGPSLLHRGAHGELALKRQNILHLPAVH